MPGKSLWGPMPDIDSIRTPHEILAQQGNYLSEMTEGLLNIEIDRLQKSALFSYEFSIVVETFKYRQVILRITHDIKLFPSILRDEQSGEEYTAKTQAEFEDDLGTILSSETTQTIVKGLMAQARLETAVSH